MTHDHGLATSNGDAVRIRGLTKTYGDKAAVDGIDLDIHHGEIFALLGPNGAGKTTTVEILEGYRARDAGDVTVLGHDPGRERAALAPRIGMALQETAVEPYLTVRETVGMYAGFYPHPRDVDEVIDLVGLTPSRADRVVHLSGGQKRRLDMAVALAGDPELLFLDEPTTGFDPAARARRVGHREQPRRPRQDRRADHSLHGRGAAPRAPRGGDGQRPDRRPGHAGDLGRARPHLDARAVPASPRGSTSPRSSPASRPPKASVSSRSTTRSRRCTRSPAGRSTPVWRSTVSRCSAPPSRTCTCR